jgi:hypothetical protein
MGFLVAQALTASAPAAIKVSDRARLAWAVLVTVNVSFFIDVDAPFAGATAGRSVYLAGGEFNPLPVRRTLTVQLSNGDQAGSDPWPG